MKMDFLDYAATQVRNRETFFLNYGNDFRAFSYQIDTLLAIWSRIGTEKDLLGRLHTDILLFANILFRHAILGFQHIASYQSYLAWLVFRPGLEAFLFLGKFVDDPTNAKIWKERLINHKEYQKTFSGKGLLSKSLPRCNDFRDVLTRLNDGFMHPNLDFTYRDMGINDAGEKLTLVIQFFDVNSDEHEGHLLAYLNLLDQILLASESLVNVLYGRQSNASSFRHTFAEAKEERATNLSLHSSTAKKVMEEFGLWKFSRIA